MAILRQRRRAIFGSLMACLLLTIPPCESLRGQTFEVLETAEQITLSTPQLQAAIRKQGYVSGVAAGSLLDRKSGFRDVGYGLDIVDWIMEPGSDENYRADLDEELIYRFNTPYHGKTPKRSIEGPQICTQAKRLQPRTIRGKDFVAFVSSYRYQTAAPGKQKGSLWTQTIVFPAGKRYFVSSDRIDARNSSPAMFLRIDMPGHIKHDRGNTFSEIYLSYHAPRQGRTTTIPAARFFTNFAPDEQFNYRRDRVATPPRRFIRAYRLRDPQTGKQGPWLAGMTLDPSVVHEAWCHQRGYVCMIEEFGGRPVQAGESFSAAFIVGYFDSIAEMHNVYDQHLGASGLTATAAGWKLTRSKP
ncbi:MAG: hypothetical protein CMJ75_16900 [Planctomycetaceae bacterium]|nr:hypothetical protein [Planctomycetaceae bacterium]